MSGNQNRNQQSKPGQAQRFKKDSQKSQDHIPTLRHGDNTNLMEWKDRMITMAGKEYGDIAASVLMHQDYGLPDEPQLEEYDIANNPIMEKLYLEDFKDYRREEQDQVL